MESEPSSSPSFSTSRRWFIGFHVLLSIAAVGAILVMVNYLAIRHFARVNLSGDEHEKLSPTTIQVLKSLTNDVRVVIYFDPEEPLYPYVSSMLHEYASVTPHLKLESVNYHTEPSKAALVKEEFHLGTGSKDLVLFSANNKMDYVAQGDLSELDMSELLKGTSREVKRKSFLGERFFTSKILSVSDPKPRKAYYLFRHREHDLTSDAPLGYKKFSDLLKNNNVHLEPLDLIRSAEVPADCDTLIIAGLEAELETGELDKIDRYLAQGGRLFLLLNFKSPQGIQRILAKWGVSVGNNVVYDEQNMQGQEVMVVNNLGSHTITQPLVQSKLNLYVLLPRSVERLPGIGTQVDAAQVTDLMTTGPNAVARTDFHRGVGLPYASLRDRRGAIPLAVAVEKGGIKDVRLQRGVTRLVVTGDSYFLDNDMIRVTGNEEFARQSINWLMDRSQLLGNIGPREFTQYVMVVTQSQMTFLNWIMLGALPGGVLVFGLLVWLRRQR